MSITAPTAIPPDEATPTLSSDDLWRVSVEKYHEMIEAGILTEDDPVELLGGWLVTKMPKNPPHSLATNLTRATLSVLVPARWFARAQDSITT